jgi:hypothetical protein
MLAQTTAGTISGTVVDSSDAVIPGVEVTLLSERTGETRKAGTSASGDFLFAAVQPGVYTVTVVAKGFKEFRLVGISLSASQRLVLGNLRMDVGGTVDTYCDGHPAG